MRCGGLAGRWKKCGLAKITLALPARWAYIPGMDEILENTLANRFAWMMEWFCKKIAPEAFMPRADGPVAVAAWARFGLLGRRFSALLAQWQAGTLPVGPAVVAAGPRGGVVR